MHALLVAAVLSLPPSVPQAERPNVVLLISDDQAWNDFGFMGSEDVATPRLDALAEQSLAFPRGYVPTALCRASLATIITGLYPHQHKITGNDPPKGEDRARMLKHIAAVDTLPKLLAGADYRSLQTGKWWEGECRCGGFTEGMTHGDPKRGGRHGDLGLKIGRKTMAPAFDFIDECAAAETPFFLWYAPFLPHTPHNPPERLLRPYLNPERRPNVPEPVAKYWAMCTWFDETCGQILDHLESRDLTRKTIVVLVTDNGWIQRPDRNGFAPRSKRSPYDAGVRTPILFSWPGTIAPSSNPTPVSSVDIAPTILAACGVKIPAALPGVDLRSSALATRGPIFGAAYTHDAVDIDAPAKSLLTRWVLDGKHKLLVHTNPGQEDELFDIVADPFEEVSLRNEAVAKSLRAALDAWWRPDSDE
ncbi:MAG: sulfatase-like hydrolase/transferase [Planctomycetota bacterium]